MIRLEQIVSKGFRYSKNLLISNHYAISLTGTRAVIMDRQFNVLHEIHKLDYVYYGEISTSEKLLLLVSSGNLFYLFSLETYELISKHRINGVFDSNLEGRGCFSFDEKKILIVMEHKYAFYSAVRVFNINNLDEYQDYCFEKRYLLRHIRPVLQQSLYLLEGLDRKNNNNNTLVWFDGQNYSAYSVDGKKDYVDVEYDESKNRVTLFGIESTRVVDREGKLLQILSDGNRESYFRTHDRDINKPICEELNDILAICNSTTHSFVYIGTGEGLLIYDPHKDEILYKRRVLYGVHKIMELRSDLISVSSIEKNLLFQVIIE